MRLLCYVMETDNMEVLTPICVSLTNLAERQFQGADAEASTAAKSRRGEQHPRASWPDGAGGCPRLPTLPLPQGASRSPNGAPEARPCLSLSPG